jgi:hypothetical protein
VPSLFITGEALDALPNGVEFSCKANAPKGRQDYAGLEVLTIVFVIVAISWDIAACSPYVKLRFGGKYSFIR